jgi:small-conductance mechanosensitive channel
MHSTQRPVYSPFFIASLFLLSVFLFVVSIAPSVAQAAEDEALVTAPVTLDGSTLFRVRGVTALPAEKRADNIGQRIAAFAEDDKIPLDSMRNELVGGVHYIYAGKQMLVGFVQADAGVEDVSLATLVLVAGDAIRTGVTRYREERQPRALLLKLAEAIGLVLAIALFVFLLIRFKAWVVVRVERRLRARMDELENLSRNIVRAQQIWQVGEALFSFSLGVLMVTAVSIGLSEVLALFPWTRGIGVVLQDALMLPLGSLGRALVDYLPKFVMLVLIIMLFRFILKMMRAMFEAIDQGRIQLKAFDPEWTWPTYKLVRFGVLAFAVVMAYPFIPGSQSEAFKGMTILLGVLLSIGSSSIIANIVAGYSMAFRRAFKIGDRIRVGDTVGLVMERRLLVTHVRTVKNEEVVIPNSIILGSEIVNYSSMAKDDGVVVSTTVGIGYDTPWRQVESMLLLAAARTQGQKPETQPFVRQKLLNSFDVTYEINVYCDDAQLMPLLLTRLNREVLDVFNEFNVQIMTPAYENDPDDLKLVPRELWYAAPAQPPAGA